MKKLLVSSGLAVLLTVAARGQTVNLLGGGTNMVPPGTLSVFKAGDSSGIWNISSSKVQPCFIQIFDTTTNNQAMPIYSMPLPTNQPNGIWINAHAGSEGGGISRTTSRQFLALEGYTGNILSPTAPKPSADPTVYRGIGLLDAFGNEQVIYQDQANWFGMPPGITQNNPTGIASTDGTNFWGTGNVAGTSQEAAGTLFYNAFESSTPFELQNYIQAAAEARIIGGTLYVVVPGQGVYNFLDPFNNFAVVPLPFDPDVPNPVEHIVATNLFLSWGSKFKNVANFDMNAQGTLAYGADQTFGIVKMVNTNGTWTQASYFFNSNNIGSYMQPAAQQGCFGICVDFSGTNPIIYATTMEYGAGTTGDSQGNPNNNRLIRIVDTGVNPGTNLVAQTLATASTTNENFRGVDFSPDLRPFIGTQPATWATTNTGTAYFSVGAQSVYPLSYQWLQNSNILSGQTAPTLQLSGVDTSENGDSIQVIVTNQYGSVTSTIANLVVTASPVAPTIGTVSNKVTAFVAGIVTFPPVTPSGTETFTYQWYFGGTALSDGTKYNGSQSDSLSITNVQTGDSGNYYLVVSNAAGYASNLVDILSVSYHAVSIPGGEPISVTTFVGYSTSLTVAGEGGNAPITNQWYKGSTALSDSGEYSGSGTTTLTINPASLSDAGSYKVVASNPAGSVTSTVATVTVLVPPAHSSVAYSNQIYFQNFDSLPDPGSNSVNSINNPMDAGSINGIAYSLANPFDFAYPVVNSSFVGGLGLSNTLAGWYGAADTQFPGVDGITRFGAQDGDQTTGGVIDFGPNNGPGITGTNRALGLLSTGTTGSTTYALKLINTSATTLNYLSVGFTGELWHNGTGHRVMSVGYTIDPTATNFTLTSQSISNSTYIPSLAFSFPTAQEVTTIDGTQAANQTNCVADNVPLSSAWTPGSALWLIWAIDYYGSGSGNGYAIDNLSVFATPTAYAQAQAPVLGGVTYSSGSGAGFNFSNVPDGHFSVYGATNLAAPSWIYLGSPTETPNGITSIYSFVDPHASTNKQRFYKVTSP